MRKTKLCSRIEKRNTTMQLKIQIYASTTPCAFIFTFYMSIYNNNAIAKQLCYIKIQITFMGLGFRK